MFSSWSSGVLSCESWLIILMEEPRLVTFDLKPSFLTVGSTFHSSMKMIAVMFWKVGTSSLICNQKKFLEIKGTIFDLCSVVVRLRVASSTGSSLGNYSEPQPKAVLSSLVKANSASLWFRDSGRGIRLQRSVRKRPLAGSNCAETGALLNVADETLIKQTTPLLLVLFNGMQKQLNKNSFLSTRHDIN